MNGNSNGLQLIKVVAGQRLNLTKTASDNNLSLDKILVGLGWDENDSGSGHDFDADVSIGFLTEGKCMSNGRFLFYNSNSTGDLTQADINSGKKPDLKVAENGVAYAEHSGDNRTGEGDGDDESVAIMLSKVPSDVTEISVFVTIHDAQIRNQNFGMLNNSFIRIVDVTSGTEIMKWDLDFDASTDDAVKFGSLLKRDGDWYFSANKTSEAGGLGGIITRLGL